METQTPEKDGLILPPKAPEEPATIHRNASWGAIISIFVILAMIVVGAFYAWGKRVAQEHAASAPSFVHKT